MNEFIRPRSQIGTLESHICGLMVVFTFFGEHFKIMGIPLYIFPLIICILLLLVDNHFKIRKPRGLQFSRIETFSAVLILFATITLPFSLKSVGSQPYIKTVVTALIMLVVAKNIYDEESFELILKYVLVGIIITAATSGYELLTGHHFNAKIQSDERLFRMGRDNSFGFQINVNDNASLMAISLFIPVLFFRKRGFVNRTFSLILIGVLFAITSAIDARLPLLALLISGVECIVLLLISRYTKGAVPKFLLGIIIAVLCIVYFASFSVSSFLGVISNSQSYSYDYSRLLFMQWSLKTISPVSFLFGNGCGVTQGMIGYSIHSVPLELLCDNGIVVAIAFMYLIIMLQFSFADRISRAAGIYFSCFATAFFLISFCSSSMLRIRSIWVLFVVIWKIYSLLIQESSPIETTSRL